MQNSYESYSLNEKSTLDLAKIAHMQLSASEVAIYTKDLDALLHYMNEVINIPTKGIEPMYVPFQRAMALREDVPRDSDANILTFMEHQKQAHCIGPAVQPIE